jgi:hypothetical protein
MPTMQRNESIMWLHAFIVCAYAFFFLSAAIIVVLCVNEPNKKKQLLMALNISGIL